MPDPISLGSLSVQFERILGGVREIHGETRETRASLDQIEGTIGALGADIRSLARVMLLLDRGNRERRQTSISENPQ